MSKKCRVYSESKLGLATADNRKAFYAGWDAALRERLAQQEIDPETRTKDGLKYSPNYVAGYNDGLQAAQRKPLTDEQKDAERYRWLRDNNASFTWIPSRYNEKTVSGFSAFGTGYLGFEFEAAVDLAIEAKLKEKNHGHC